jgi:hypothetical protein
LDFLIEKPGKIILKNRLRLLENAQEDVGLSYSLIQVVGHRNHLFTRPASRLRFPCATGVHSSQSLRRSFNLWNPAPCGKALELRRTDHEASGRLRRRLVRQR